MSKTALEKLIDRRDQIDEMFLHYGDEQRLMTNIAVLSQLALIGGRLDTLIRREQARQREQRRRGVTT